VIMGVTSLSLVGSSRLHRLLTLAQLAGYGAAAAAILAPRSRLSRLKPVSLAGFFVLVNAASVHAAIDVLRGRRIERWEPVRAETEDEQ
jgi:hypothetical protein